MDITITAFIMLKKNRNKKIKYKERAEESDQNLLLENRCFREGDECRHLGKYEINVLKEIYSS